MPIEIILSAAILVIGAAALGLGMSNRLTQIASLASAANCVILLLLPWLGEMPAAISAIVFIYWVAALPVAPVVAFLGISKMRNISFGAVIGAILLIIGGVISIWILLRGIAYAAV